MYTEENNRMTVSMNNEPEQQNQPQQPWAPAPSQTPPQTPPAPAPVPSFEPAAPQQVVPQADPYAAPAPTPLVNPVPSYQPQPSQPQPTPLIPVPPQAEPQQTSPFQPQVQPQFASQPPLPTQSQPPQKGKKKLIIAIIAAVTGLILLAAAVIVYLTFFYVSKDDYVQVQTVLSEIDKEIDETPSLAGVSTSASTLDALEKKSEAIKEANKKLVDLKALKNDKELKEKYETYMKSSDATTQLVDGFVASTKKITPSVELIGQLASEGFMLDGSQQVITSLEGVGTLDDETSEAFRESILASYKKVNTAARSYENAPSLASQNAYTNTIYAVAEELNKAFEKYQNDYKDRTDKIKVGDHFDELSKAVDAKVNK